MLPSSFPSTYMRSQTVFRWTSLPSVRRRGDIHRDYISVETLTVVRRPATQRTEMKRRKEAYHYQKKKHVTKQQIDTIIKIHEGFPFALQKIVGRRTFRRNWSNILIVWYINEMRNSGFRKALYHRRMVKNLIFLTEMFIQLQNRRYIPTSNKMSISFFSLWRKITFQQKVKQIWKKKEKTRRPLWRNQAGRSFEMT